MCAYQMSSVRIAANSAIPNRYALTDSTVTARASTAGEAVVAAAIVKLTAIRFRSYSNGPGRVSSKSFRPKSSSRSGEAKSRSSDRWASPQSCTTRPAIGVVARSLAITLAAPR
jgi:hypothetical protein